MAIYDPKDAVHQDDFNSYKDKSADSFLNFHKFMEEMKTHIEYIKRSLDDNKEEHKEILGIIQNWCDKADAKYASKLTERIVYGLLSLFGVAIVGALVKLIILK